MQNTDAPLRYCLTTLEHDHAWWIADQIVETPNVTLVGVADEDPDRLGKMQGKLKEGARFYTQAAQMLKELKPDALVITARNKQHRSLVELCAEQKVDCFLQKPMAAAYSDAQAMEQAAQKAGIRLMVNTYPLWDPLKAELFRKVLAGEIGPIHQITVVNGHQGPHDMGVLSPQYIGWLYDEDQQGGGALADQGSYGLAYAVWVLGKPSCVFATSVPLKKHAGGEIDELSTILLQYPKATVVVQASWAWAHPRDELNIFGAQGSLCYREGVLTHKNAPASYNLPVNAESISAPKELRPERRNGITYFTHCLRHDLPFEPPFTARLNGIVCEVVNAARESAALGKVIRLEPTG